MSRRRLLKIGLGSAGFAAGSLVLRKFRSETPADTHVKPDRPASETAAGPLERAFEEQWNHPRIITFGQDKLRIFDLRPDPVEARRERALRASRPSRRNRPETPIEKENREKWNRQREALLEKLDLPILFVPGWIQNLAAARRNLLAMYKEGCRLIMPDSAHGIPATDLRKNKDAAGMVEAELRKTAAILKSLEATNVERVDAIAHSEGAINLVMAAFLFPERFRNIVLIDPAGMIGKDNLIALASRSTREGAALKHERQLRREGKKPPFEFDFDAKEMSRYDHHYFTDTPWATIKEALAIAHADLREMVSALRNKGIGVTVISGVEDLQFPMDKMQAAVNIGHVRGFSAVEGSHQAFFQEPSLYSGPVLHQLAALANRRPRQSDKQRGG